MRRRAYFPAGKTVVLVKRLFQLSLIIAYFSSRTEQNSFDALGPVSSVAAM